MLEEQTGEERQGKPDKCGLLKKRDLAVPVARPVSGKRRKWPLDLAKGKSLCNFNKYCGVVGVEKQTVEYKRG